MTAIEQSKWTEVSVFTWEDLLEHKWEDFRTVLMETETEQVIQGVAIRQGSSIAETLIESPVQGVKVVFSPIVMETRSSMIVSIVVSERNYKEDMLNYLPLYERKSNVFNEILTAYDRELRGLEQSLEVVNRNIFLDTAIESLSIHERDLGITPTKNLRYDQRREQIASRNRASLDQTTEETIKSVASAYSNGEVEIKSADILGNYEVKFVSTKGVPSNIEGLKKALDIIIPAHLGLSFSFTFNAWEFLSDKTWGQVGNLSWNELRTWNEVS